MTYTITVLFPNDADAQYDIEYYVSHHMPLIERHWKKFGVQSWCVTTFDPSANGEPAMYKFGSIVTWESKEGIQKAFESPEVTEIMGDVPKFSNKQPVFLFGPQV
jgi:uncharacterized protein (TIGR02118 family)